MRFLCALWVMTLCVQPFLEIFVVFLLRSHSCLWSSETRKLTAFSSGNMNTMDHEILRQSENIYIHDNKCDVLGICSLVSSCRIAYTDGYPQCTKFPLVSYFYCHFVQNLTCFVPCNWVNEASTFQLNKAFFVVKILKKIIAIHFDKI